MIVFDVQGVLLADAIPKLLRELTRRGVRWNEKAYTGWYHGEIESRLFMGEISPKEFWQEMLDNQGIPLDETQQWEDYFREHTIPLLEEKDLSRWASKAELAIVANGMPEWFTVPLRSIGVHKMVPLSRVILSANYLSLLPDQEMFGILLDLMPHAPEAVVYVSAQADHGAAAEDFGWTWIYADPEGMWEWEIDDYLNLAGPDRDAGMELD